MINKSLTFVFVLLMLSSLFVMTDQASVQSTQNIITEKMNTIAETDLDRVDWIENVAPNRDFETWGTPYRPDNLYTTRTVEESGWYETTIFNQGIQSVGMEARALDPTFFAEVRLSQTSFSSWDNPVNTTLDMDWYIDEIGNPDNVDYFRIQVRMGNPARNMYYYLGCDTGYDNGTEGYFLIDEPAGTWNHLHRNITSDYIEIFSEIPTAFYLVYIWIRSYTNEYTRVFVDDFSIVNGTDVRIGGSTNNGDFETTSGWSLTSSTDPADISQSSLSYAGDWSMNMTAISYDDLARATAQASIGKRLTEINQGQLSFYWRIDDWVNPALNTIASVKVSAATTSYSFSMYYFLCVGGAGTLPMLIFGQDMKFQVANFNVTDTWNHFDRNIWEDFQSISSGEELWIENIAFQVNSATDDSRLSVLFDELNFTASIVNDMGYETQGDLGTPVEGWKEPISDPEFSVTDFAYTGNRAGNITLENSVGLNHEQHFGVIPFDSTTELILDFSMYIETFNESSYDYIFIEIYLDDGSSIAFIIANASSEVEGNISNDYIILQENIVTGQWLNFQIDLVHTFEAVIGSIPDTTLDYMILGALASEDSKLVAFIDDFYIYYDVAPEIASVGQTPTVIEEAGELIGITAEVVDASAITVTLSYRVDSGAWTNVTMAELAGGTFSYELSAPMGVTEYYLVAEDAFSKTDTAMDGGDYFSFSTTDTVGPVISLLPANGSTVSDIVSVEFNVTDFGSGFAWSQLLIEGAEITNTTIDTVGISWDTTIIPDGVYNITVVAVDNVGNTASVTHLVTVENVGAPADLSGVILIVVIIALAAIAAIYVFVLKKK